MNARQMKKHEERPRDGIQFIYGPPTGPRRGRRIAGIVYRRTVEMGSCDLRSDLQKAHEDRRASRLDPQQEFRWLRDAMLRIVGETEGGIARWPRSNHKPARQKT
jgi:hypothetical protein